MVAISKWQAGNQQLTMLVIILWCPWLLRAGPDFESGNGYGHRKQSTCEASQPANPMTKFISGFIVVQILGPNLLTKGGLARSKPPRLASPPLPFDSRHRESFAANRSNACTEPISRVPLTHLCTLPVALTRRANVNQIRNWNRVN